MDVVKMNRNDGAVKQASGWFGIDTEVLMACCSEDASILYHLHFRFDMGEELVAMSERS